MLLKRSLLKIAKLNYRLVFMALICLLFVGSCKKDQTDSKSHTLESYKGTDRLVLDVINELKKPENSDLVKRLDAKEEIDWKNHKTLIPDVLHMHK